MVRSRYRRWHLAFIPFDIIYFQRSPRPSLAFCRFVMRRYSSGEGGWIYARLGTRVSGEMTR